MSGKIYYGLNSRQDIFRAAARAVRTFGGDDDVFKLLIGTCCTETDLGTFRDRHPDKAGVSLVQFDDIRFTDLQSRTRRSNLTKFYKEYGVHLRDLELSDLANEPYIAMACCRLAYILVPESVPSTLEGQAQYWKTYWNTYHPNAKGTPESYLEDWDVFLGDDIALELNFW